MRIYFIFALLGPARLQRILLLACFALSLFPFWLIGCPWYIDAVFAAFALWLAIRHQTVELALTGLSLLTALIIAAIVFQNSVHSEETRTYFRPDDMYWGGPRPHTFKTDIDVNFPMPHGDLGGISSLPQHMFQPRTVRFKTDNLGWRNDAPYAGQHVVVCGDSFALGTGNTQEETLANILTRQFNLPTYSVAFPGDPQDYFDMSLDFLKITNTKPDIHMIVFEGNDFAMADCPSLSNVVVPSLYWTLKISVAHFLEKKAALFPFLVNAWAQLESQLLHKSSGTLFFGKARGQDIVFLTPYVQAALCPDLRLVLDRPHQEVLARLKAVYFVPTKYRVYQPLLDMALSGSVQHPPAGLTALHNFFDSKGIAVVDLSSALRETAKQELEHGKLIFWRDDTHWNKEAIQVAAKAVFEMQGRK